MREEWTEEQIEDLIVGSGAFVHPDKVQVRGTVSFFYQGGGLSPAGHTKLSRAKPGCR